MAAELREFRAPARDLLVGDLATWHQHAFCEVVERSYGPDPATIRTDDGRFIPVPPGEWVDVRRLEEAVPEVEEPVTAQVEDPDGWDPWPDDLSTVRPINARGLDYRVARGAATLDRPAEEIIRAHRDGEVLALGPDAEMGGLPLIERAYEQIDALIDAAQLLRILLRQIGAGGETES